MEMVGITGTVGFMPTNNIWLLLPNFQEALNNRTPLHGDLYRISSMSLKKYGYQGQKFIYILK
jgi:hypothetical protein